MASIAVLSQACLTRPVSKQDPTTKVNFTATVRQQAVDKIDLLLAIDNSASMGDKQAILKTAIPDLVGRLLRPNCVDASGQPTGATADPTKPRETQCPAGQEPEFKPVADMHVAIVSSSLGAFGGSTQGCANDKEHQNDKGRLLARTKNGPSQQVESGNYLAWFPDVPANEGKTAPAKGIKDEKQFVTALQDLVVGVDQIGCGLEAQLESMYHFLIQPDPWDTITLTDTPQGKKASYGGLDESILAQRKDFLRPDSLVAVLMVTDEDDSSSDPLAVSGQGWAFMDPSFPGSTQARPGGNAGTTAPRGTQACATNPTSADCTSCAFKKSDPACQDNGGYYGPDDDSLNVRFFHMKQRYGLDPQYPLSRYVNGLKSRKIPDRNSEHATNGSGVYIGTTSCVNPLFAKNLPGSAQEAIKSVNPKTADGKTLTDDQRLAAGLCNLQPGPRTPDLVYFAVLGGAPNSLLFDGAYGDSPKPKATINFRELIGNDPVAYDYSGADPHMQQSIEPRGSLPAPDAIGKNGSDVVHGREWDTKKGDLQYACTFPLDAPLAAPRDCSASAASCDCDGVLSPPLCSTNKGGKEQIRAKAYPTIRQYAVAKGVGEQGIVATLCPLVNSQGKLFQDKNGDGSPNPFYGYRPAVQSIIDRLKNALANQCLPQALTPDTEGRVPCLILEVLANPGPQTECNKPQSGLKQPDAQVLQKFREDQQKEYGDPTKGGIDLAKYPICEVTQIVKKAGETCAKDQAAGWCYVTNTDSSQPAGACPQAIVFSPAGNPQVGAKVNLQCIQQFGAGTAAGGK